MDINLWGSFHKLESLSSSLTKTMGARLVSNYRVVVGGMYGSSTWDQDRELIGPQIIQNRDCSEREMKENASKKMPKGEELVTAAVEESLTNRTDALAVVFCDTEGSRCLAKDILNDSTKIAEVVLLSTCSKLDAAEPTTLYDCEISLLFQWKEALASRSSDVVAIDGTVSVELLQIINSILSDDTAREAIISDANLFLTWSFRPDKERWRKQFVDRYRKQHMHDPISRASFHMQAGEVVVDFGVVSAGDNAVAYHLETVEKSLQTRFKEAEIELRVIHGGNTPTGIHGNQKNSCSRTTTTLQDWSNILRKLSWPSTP